MTAVGSGGPADPLTALLQAAENMEFVAGGLARNRLDGNDVARAQTLLRQATLIRTLTQMHRERILYDCAGCALRPWPCPTIRALAACFAPETVDA